MNWELLESFRGSVEAEFVKNVLGKPERLPAYQETIGVLKDALGQYEMNLENPEVVYAVSAGIVSSLSFISNYFQTVCPDPHPLGHLSESAVFLGYLIRDLCFAQGVPMVTA